MNPDSFFVHSGLFIAVEGPDGAGKTTAAKLLAQRFAGLGHEVFLTREPGGTPLGELVRGLVCARKNPAAPQGENPKAPLGAGDGGSVGCEAGSCGGLTSPTGDRKEGAGENRKHAGVQASMNAESGTQARIQPGINPSKNASKQSISLTERLANGDIAICPEAEHLLFQAARAQHVEEAIKPALLRGAVVICDRFTLSTLAYQGVRLPPAVGNLSTEDFIEIVSERTSGGLRPDLTVVLNVSPQMSLRRMTERGLADRFDSLTVAQRIRIHEIYHEQAPEGSSEPVQLFDASRRTPEQLRDVIWDWAKHSPANWDGEIDRFFERSPLARRLRKDAKGTGKPAASGGKS